MYSAGLEPVVGLLSNARVSLESATSALPTLCSSVQLDELQVNGLQQTDKELELIGRQ